MQSVKIAVLFTFFFNFSATATPLSKEPQVPKNSIYASCGHYLFDQQDVVATKAFQDASQETKSDLLEAEFNRRRRLCYATELAKVGATLAPVLLGFYKFYHRINNNQAAALGVGGGFMMYGAMSIFGNVLGEVTRFIQAKIDSARSITYSLIYPSGTDSIEKYELRYVRQKPFIKKELQEILEENFISSRIGEAKNERAGFENANKEKKSPVEFARNVLALPTTKMEVTYDPARIEASLGSFNKEVLVQLKRFAVRHAAASTGEAVKKIVAYFEGPPGVGKTLAAERLTQTLQVPFHVIKLGGATVADIEGTATKPGLILEALLKAKYDGRGAKNMIIFFDEIDRALGMTPSNPDEETTEIKKGARKNSKVDSSVIPFLLTLLEPGQKTFYSPYLGIDIDISSLGFLMAGNYKLTVEALVSRCEIVRFEGYTSAFKKMVTDTRLFAELLAPFKTSKLPLVEGDFTAQDWAKIHQMIDDDKDPGFRTIITNLQNIMSDKVLCKHYNDCAH